MKLITMCSYCEKYQDPESGDWIKPINYPFEIDKENISHGVCPVCLKKQLKEIEKL